MTVGEEGEVAFQRLQPIHEWVDASGHVRGTFAARTAVAPEVPSRLRLTDLGRGESLVLAVVPLEEGIAQLRAIAEAGEAAGVERPSERTGQRTGRAPL